MDCTLLADGSSDSALIHILQWILRRHGVQAQRFERYDAGRFKNPPRTLREKIDKAVDYYPCDVLFIHRDAEREDYDQREAEVLRALGQSRWGQSADIPAVLVIPVRMTEAWLLFKEGAIREAAGNPAGRVPLGLPPIRRCEELADPKQKLHLCLRTATEYAGRRLQKFNVDAAIHRLAELIDDYSPLLSLHAFQRLDEQIAELAHRPD